MKRFTLARVIFFGLAPLAVACGTDSVVGGRCNHGYLEVDGICVPRPAGGDTSFDPTTPPPGVDPTVGSTRPDPEGTTTPPASDPPGSPDVDAGSPDGPPSPDVDAGSPDGSASPDVDASSPDATSPPIVTPPELQCAAPLVACRGSCISVESDPRSCGACGRVCPSNICIAGVCQGATPGSVVLIGHDMSQAWTGSVQAQVLSNAVSIPTTEPIRVLSYEAGVEAETAAYHRLLVMMGVTGRLVQFTSASAETLDSPRLYASYDIVLVHGAGADADAVGGRLSAPLQTFTRSGGVFIALDSGSSDVPRFVNATGLLAVGAHQPLDDLTHFVVEGANDVVGTKLLSPYASFGPSVAFTGVEPEGADVTYVVRTADDAKLPIVVHKIAR